MAEYDTVDETGETKRQQNERFGLAELSKEAVLSNDAMPYWDLFLKVSRLRSSGFGIEPLKPGDLIDWSRATGARLTTDEMEILLKADAAYVGKVRELDLEKRRAKAEENPKGDRSYPT